MAFVSKMPSGWCNTAALLERGEVASSHSASWFHGKCPAATERPPGNLPWRCPCPCHDHTTIIPRSRHAATQERAVKVVTEHRSGKRDGKLLDAIYSTLRERGEIEFDAPSDPKQNKSLRERIYTAARKNGMKVKVVNDLEAGKIRATVKDGRQR